MEEDSRLGEAIRRHRKARRLSAVQLSQRAGLSDGYVAMLESGRNKRPGIQVMAKIAAVLDMSLDDLARADADGITARAYALLLLDSNSPAWDAWLMAV